MNIKSAVFALFFLLPFLCQAQQTDGVQFYTNLSLAQALKKAKSENKYVFIDCYATWCGPCKMMDKEVYSQQKVADLINAKFIAVKFQMDSTAFDPQNIKALYPEINRFNREYPISAFPTFLFFSPDGELVHKAVGARNADEFVQLADTAVNPKYQYYTQLALYEAGEKEKTDIPYIVRTSSDLNDLKTAKKVAMDYLSTLAADGKESELLKKERIQFIFDCIALHLLSVHDMPIQFLYRNARQVDQINNSPGFTQKMLDYQIAHELVDPHLFKEGKILPDPDWAAMSKNIQALFDADYADRVIFGAKDRYFGASKQFNLFTANKVRYVNKYLTSFNNWDLDVHAWAIFQHSDKPEELKAAVKWIEKVLKAEPDWPNAIDTYANLLYKLKSKKDYLKIEERAVKLGAGIPDIAENYKKMQANEPTW